jgi:hypothetical protein
MAGIADSVAPWLPGSFFGACSRSDMASFELGSSENWMLYAFGMSSAMASRTWIQRGLILTSQTVSSEFSNGKAIPHEAHIGAGTSASPAGGNPKCALEQ